MKLSIEKSGGKVRVQVDRPNTPAIDVKISTAEAIMLASFLKQAADADRYRISVQFDD